MWHIPLLAVLASAALPVLPVAAARLRSRGATLRSPAFVANGTSQLIARGALGAPLYPGGPPIFTAEDADIALQARVPGSLAVSCVIDGRAVTPCAPLAASGACACDLSFLSLGGLHSAAAYAAAGSGSGGIAARLGEEVWFTITPAPETAVRGSAAAAAAAARLAASERALRSGTPPGTGVLGVYYTTYQNQVSQLYQNVSRASGQPSVTMQDVVASDGALLFRDSSWKHTPGFNASAPETYQGALFMSAEPALGIYCYYRKRANESAGADGGPGWGTMADCPEAAHVLQTHAAELSAAGFAFIAPDATNWDGDPRIAANGADLNQLRPTEIIAEEWANMRLAGAATPQLSTFDRVNAGGLLYQWYLSEFFNNDTLLALDLILRNPNTTRVPGTDKVYIVADEPLLDYNLVRLLQHNGGRNDIVTPIMWSAPDASGNYEENGYLKYFSPCTEVVRAANGSESRVFSPDVFFDGPCGHMKTLHSPVGDVWTVSSGLPMNSIPFAGARYNGLFLKKQFYDVFVDPTPTDMLFAPSWNEFASSAHSMLGWNISNPLFVARGATAHDPDRHVIVFDDFTSERSRFLEPTTTDGGYYYELFASCMRVYRLQAALGRVSDGAGCDVAGEECCLLHADEDFVRVHSLQRSGADGQVLDALLTPDAAEARTLAAAGWSEFCVAALDQGNMRTAALCYNATLIWSGGEDLGVLRGPLLLYRNSSTGLPNTAPLVRCVTAGSPPLHFVDNSTECAGGRGEAEFVLGFGSARRDGLFSSEVRRCAVVKQGGGAALWYYTVASGACGKGDVDEGIIGYTI